MSMEPMVGIEVSDRAGEVFLLMLGRFANDMADNEDGENLQKMVQARRSCAGELFVKCQSPIEEIMAAILTFVCNGYDYPEDFCGKLPEFGCIVQPQHEINSYRVDFLLSCYCKGFSRHVVVECDGHDFHEKTKEQVARDKARDRKIAATGATILRFSGSELYKRPLQIRDEIESVLEDVMYETERDAGHVKRTPNVTEINRDKADRK